MQDSIGSIYERFLGNVIVADSRGVRIEPKEELRKAHGVYYTPQYIVRYVVENTIGSLIAGKTPSEIAQMRFIDIACGSGSFLLGVYDLLLNYHARYYNGNPRRARRGDCVERDGVLYLSLEKKRSILLNNIFGVDIDSQAVEVTQLSLYLKLLEEETIASARGYQTRWHLAILPTLNQNIICGNSLIGIDVLEGELFGREEKKRLNAMDFGNTFSETMRRGGFDAVVGNPPYVKIQALPRVEIDYLTEHYRSANGSCDLYVSFVERGYNILKPGGKLGEIVQNKFFKTEYGEGLRHLVASNRALQKVVNFGANQVFEATTYTCLLFLNKGRSQNTFQYAKADASEEALAQLRFTEIAADSLGAGPWSFLTAGEAELLTQIHVNSQALLDLPAEMNRGISTGADEVFVFKSGSLDIEPQVVRIPVYAEDFGRYRFEQGRKWSVIFPYTISDGEAQVLSEGRLRDEFPKAFAFLRANASKLKERKQPGPWYGFSAPRSLALHESAQLMVPLLARSPACSVLPESLHGSFCVMAGAGFSVTISPRCPYQKEYVLALLNSRLLFWALVKMSQDFRGGWVTCTKQYFGKLPIHELDLTESAQKAKHDQLASLTRQVLGARTRLAQARTDRDKDYYTRTAEALERQIDALVYDLYGLTRGQIEMVERASDLDEGNEEVEHEQLKFETD